MKSGLMSIKAKLIVLMLLVALILPIYVFAEDVEKTEKEEETTVVKVVDTVNYTDLIVGKEYTVKGVLMDKKTQKPFLVQENEVRSEVKFTPENPTGSVDVVFNVETKYIEEDTDLVAFQEVYRGEKLVAEHKDIEDVGQTVKLRKPNVKTTATVNGEKEVEGIGEITIVDVVKYKSLIIGKEYTVRGVLMDKETNQPLLVNGQQITAEKTFVAEKNDGEVNLEFKFDASVLEKTKDLVAFEDIYQGKRKVGSHADIEDEDQTVKVRKPSIKTTATINGEKEIEVINIKADTEKEKEKAGSEKPLEKEERVDQPREAN